MKLFAVFVLTGIAAFAAVDGVVMNGTTRKPQSGATVSLFHTTQNGPQLVESVKSDADGKFKFTQEFQGPRLIQAVHQGVVYNRMIPPGMPSTNVSIPVYESAKKASQAKVDQHMMLLEPTADGKLNVNESYVFKNDSKTTWNDPDGGTLQFALPADAGGKVEINATGPGSVPVRKAADAGTKPNTFKLDFPIKPGESRVDLSWSIPFNSPGIFEAKLLYKGDGPTRVVAPKGVTFKGTGMNSLGTEPQSQATIYGVKGPDLKFMVEGVGLLKQAAPDTAADESSAPKLTENLPKIYGLISSTTGLLDTANSVKWFLIVTIGMLACGFVLLYRKPDPQSAAPTKANNARTRR